MKESARKRVEATRVGGAIIPKHTAKFVAVDWGQAWVFRLWPELSPSRLILTCLPHPLRQGAYRSQRALDHRR